MMRYRHPRKTPHVPTYDYLEYINNKITVEEYNQREESAIFWHRQYKELDEIIWATPVKVFWEAFAKEFPDVKANQGELAKTVQKHSLELKAEIDALTATIAEKDKEIKKLEQNVMDVRRVDRDAIEGWQNAFIKTRDEKDAEIERLRGALNKIYDVPNQTTIEYAVETVLDMQEIARNAL